MNIPGLPDATADEVAVMRKIRAQLAETSGKHETFVPTDVRRFRHLNLRFYEQAAAEIELLGFRRIGDYEIAEVKGKTGDPRCFLRMFVSNDGNVAASIYHPKPALWLRLLVRATGKPLGPTVEFETEFSDDAFVSSVTPPLPLFDPPPLLLRECYPAQTPISRLHDIQRARVRAYALANPGVAVRRVTDFAGVVRMQHRQTDIKGVYRQMVGGMTAEEIRRLGGFTRERAARLKRFMDGETPAEVAARPAPLPGFASRAPTEDQKVSWWKRDLSPRAIGFVLLFCGTGLGYLGFLLPWQQAQNQAPSISFSTKGAFAAVLTFGMGLPYALAPRWATRVLGHPQKLTTLGYVFAVIACVAGAVSVALFRELLRERGY